MKARIKSELELGVTLKKGKQKMKSLFKGKKKSEEEHASPVTEGNDPEPTQEEEGPVKMKPWERYGRGEGGKIVFPAQMVPLWRPPEPEPSPPEGADIHSFESLPLENVVGEAIPEIPQSRRNKDGVHFAGALLKLRLRDNSVWSGWIPAADLPKYRSWQASFRAKTRQA